MWREVFVLGHHYSMCHVNTQSEGEGLRARVKRRKWMQPEVTNILSKGNFRHYIHQVRNTKLYIFFSADTFEVEVT